MKGLAWTQGGVEMRETSLHNKVGTKKTIDNMHSALFLIIKIQVLSLSNDKEKCSSTTAGTNVLANHCLGKKTAAQTHQNSVSLQLPPNLAKLGQATDFGVRFFSYFRF